MEFNPPICERKTKELLNIISNDEKWVKEIQTLAEEELYRRNFTKIEVDQEKRKRKETLIKFRQRKADQHEINRTESYSLFEMLLIVVFFPFSLFKLRNQMHEFSVLSEGNFKKKIRQRIFLIIVSFLLWFLIIQLTF